jgi:hypothetical protein
MSQSIRRRLRLAVSAFAALLGTGSVQADVVGFEFIAEVASRAPDPANPALALPPELTVGDVVVGRIQYETIVPDTNPDPNRGQFNNLIREFVVYVDGLEFVFQPQLPGASNFAVVRNNYLPPGSVVLADSFSLIGLNGWPPYFPPNATFQVGLFGVGSSETVFFDGLPAHMPVFPNWTVFWAIFNGPTLYASASAPIRLLRPIGEESVPEPGTLGLMLLGLLGASRLAARRR